MVADEIVGHFEIESGMDKTLVQFKKPVAQVKHCPGVIFLLSEELINSRFAGLFVFEEIVGDAAVG